MEIHTIAATNPLLKSADIPRATPKYSLGAGTVAQQQPASPHGLFSRTGLPQKASAKGRSF